jgi:alanine dehydrogenase
VRVISAAEIDAVLTFERLVEALKEAFAAKLTAPPRHHHVIARGAETATLLLMPAWTGAGKASYLATKLATVFPGNAERGHPSVYATTLLMDGTTGEPLAAIDGTHLTLWRTAAASALAASYLARQDAARLLMVGAGALAPFLTKAHATVRPIREIAIWNRDGARARKLAAELSANRPQELTVVDNLESAARQADIISCATMTRTPLIRGAWLKPGAHLDLVGAFNLEMREADDEALHRASVFTDTPAALKEGGDVAVALRDGGIKPSHVLGDLEALVTGRVRGRNAASDITLFKSIGAAIEDLAAAVAVWEAVSSATG